MSVDNTDTNNHDCGDIATYLLHNNHIRTKISIFPIPTLQYVV